MINHNRCQPDRQQTRLVPNGPVAVVNAERARLREQIQTADREATRLEHTLANRAAQAAERATERDRQTRICAEAQARLATIRAAVAAPLIEQATADGAGYLGARERMWQANRALNSVGRLHRRAATRTAWEATEDHNNAYQAVRGRWGDAPPTGIGLAAWAKAVADRQTQTEPHVIAAERDAEHAHDGLRRLARRHRDAQAALWDSTDTGQQPPNVVRARVAEWRHLANHARHHLAEIEAMPATEAAELIVEREGQMRESTTISQQEVAQAAFATGESSPHQSAVHQHNLGHELGPRL